MSGLFLYLYNELATLAMSRRPHPNLHTPAHAARIHARAHAACADCLASADARVRRRTSTLTASVANTAKRAFVIVGVGLAMGKVAPDRLATPNTQQHRACI